MNQINFNHQQVSYSEHQINPNSLLILEFNTYYWLQTNLEEQVQSVQRANRVKQRVKKLFNNID